MEIDNNKINNQTIDTDFWGKNPNIIFSPQYLNEFFPTTNMNYNQKLNAISRLVIIITLLTYLTTKRMTIIVVCISSLFLIFIMHLIYEQKKKKDEKIKKITENFVNVFQSVEPQKNPSETVIKKVLQNDLLNSNSPNNNFEEILKEKTLDYFDIAKPNNPLSNVLLTDYDNPSLKKNAPPSYTEEGRENILEQTKEMINKLHPNQQPPNEEQKFTDKLFGNLSDNLAFEQSMRQYVSNPATTIPNDQTAFANFLYGGMVSCKEGNAFACVRNNLGRHIMM